MSKEVEAHILQHYEIKKLQGSGAYGHVWKVIQKASGKVLALKKIFDAFHNDIDAQRTYREISVLHELQHYNIIKLHRVMKAKNNRDLYLVFDYMETDLQSLVGEEVLEEVHTRFVIYQIIRSLKYLHSAQLIHRDLKPSNILINSQCEIKLCDFGLVRSLTHEVDEPMILTEEVATRWYRSPQLLLGSKKYGKQTDVWSVGCIIAELLMGEPIFPGDSTTNQLQKILEFTGIPSKQNIDSVDSEVCENLINQVNVHKKPIGEYFKKGSKDLISLVLKMLQFNPRKRISLDEALDLDMFSEFKTHKSNDDICTKFIVPHQDDNVRLSVQEYRKIIYSDIDRRYPIANVAQKVEKTVEKENQENRRVMRSHKSFNRQKSSDNLRVMNHHSVHSRSAKKQVSSSLHHFEQQIIQKMKKTWKKSPFNSLQSSQNPSANNSQNISQFQFKSDKLSKASEFYRNKMTDGSKGSSSQLTKVRSRKVLLKGNSKDKMESCQVILMGKKKMNR